MTTIIPDDNRPTFEEIKDRVRRPEAKQFGVLTGTPVHTLVNLLEQAAQKEEGNELPRTT